MRGGGELGGYITEGDERKGSEFLKDRIKTWKIAQFRTKLHIIFKEEKYQGDEVTTVDTGRKTRGSSDSTLPPKNHPSLQEVKNS